MSFLLCLATPAFDHQPDKMSPFARLYNDSDWDWDSRLPSFDFAMPQWRLPTAFDLILLLSLFNLVAWAVLRNVDLSQETLASARLALRTQQAVKTTILILITHTLKSAIYHSPWAAGSAYMPLPRVYTIAVVMLALITTRSVALLWPKALELDPEAFPLGRPVEFYEFGVGDASVLPSYVVMHLRARGMKTEKWRLGAKRLGLVA